MDNQLSTILQNTTNIHDDGATLHTFFQRHKRPFDDGTTGPLSKKPRIEVTADSQEAESQETAEDVVEEVRVPRTNTFKMLQNMYRARNAFVQPSSMYSVFWWSDGQKMTTAISTNEQGVGDLCLISESGRILLPLNQGRYLDLTAIYLCLLQW